MLTMVRVALATVAVLVAACGTEGPAGPQGPRGEPGVLLQSLTRCSAQTNAYVFTEERWDFSDGSVFVHCQIQDAGAAYDTTALYKSTMPGAQAGACVLPYDVDASTGGFWQFLVEKGAVVGVAEYRDASSSVNGSVVQMTCATR